MMNDEISNAPVTKANLLRFIAQKWQPLQAYIGTLNEQQLTELTDAAGWTVKDHLIHLHVWESGVRGLLEGQPQWQGMGLDAAAWDKDTDEINAIIQQRHKDMSLAEVQQTLAQGHQRLLDTINSLEDTDFVRPYNTYDTQATQTKPVIDWLVGNTFMHYHEHQPWIEAIVGQA